VDDGCFIQCQTSRHSTRSLQTNQPKLEVWQTGKPTLRLSTEPTMTRLPQAAETYETSQAGCGRMQGELRRASTWTPWPTPVSGKHPAGLADQNGSGNTSHCLSRTASASYRTRSWLARSIRASEENLPPLRQRGFIFRGLGNQASNGHRPAWLRLSMLGK